MSSKKRKSAKIVTNATQDEANNTSRKRTRFMVNEIIEENDLEMSQQNADIDFCKVRF